jgi:hypothetical protein
MKLLLTSIAIALLGTCANAQTPTLITTGKVNTAAQAVSVNPSNTGQIMYNRCGTKPPSKEWDAWFNQKVEEYKKDLMSGRTAATTYTIPIIFHIVYSQGEAVGSGHNISQAQVNSQIPILNADYGGVGYNSNQYPNMKSGTHGAFYDYAVANSLPAPDNAGTVIANSGMTFCLATKNPSGTVLAEPGIDRVSWQSVSGASDPASSSNVQSLFDGTIKPATIWDPTKYFNVWVSDGGTSGLLGYATFPGGTTLGGLSGTETNTTSGVWVTYKGLGNTGAVSAPYNYGRTLTHESGHYFGLRHIWGDGNCVTDYCNDTPPAYQANYVNWPTAYPYVDPQGTCADNGDGEMFMNFMDYSGDAAMWMFTTDQVTRMHTALAQCSNRSGLTASSVNLCNTTVSAPVASFTYPTTVCATRATAFTDNSTGPPTAWTWSVAPATGVTISPNGNPSTSITFPTVGTYTVTETVSNSSGSNSVAHVITVNSCAITTCDTVSHIKNTDTLSIYKATTGYFMGNNNYAFTGLSEAYTMSDFPTGNLQVGGAIILFFRNSTTIGTHGVAANTATTLSMVNGTTNPGAAAAASKAITFANIAATAGVKRVDYAGNPGLGYTNPIIVPYVATFTTPVPLTSDFFLSLSVGATTGDTIALFSGAKNHNTTNNAWVDYSGTWSTFSSLAGGNFSLAVIPIVCPVAVTGIEHNELGSNINMFPNPSSGIFNFAVSLTSATNLTFSVFNTVGQSVFVREENNIINRVLTYDLSGLSKGVYFVNITDSQNNKTVKKIIIQ